MASHIAHAELAAEAGHTTLDSYDHGLVPLPLKFEIV